MLKDVERILITSEEIGARVRELGQQITNDYAGQEILMIGVLRGAVIFMADLARSNKRPMDIDFMAITGYGLSTNSSGVVRIIKDLDEVVEGRHILIIEDIIDSGLTLKYLVDNIKSRKPALLILDIWMQGGGMDGLELLDLVKTLDADIPVIMISGHGNIETAVSAIKRGAYDFLEKPFKSDRLLLIVCNQGLMRYRDGDGRLPKVDFEFSLNEEQTRFDSLHEKP